MDETEQIQTIVRLVADGLVQRDAEAAIVGRLVAAGVPEADAPAVFAAVKRACQQGVQAVVTGGRSAPDGPPKDPLLAEAFRVGQARMRGAGGPFWLRPALVLAAVAGAVGLLVWLVVRG